MEKITLGQYITSKDQLRDAIQLDPIHEVTYEIYKYCKVATGTQRTLREYHNLKPKHKIIVKWRYNGVVDIPEPLQISIPHLIESKSTGTFFTYKSGESMLKWLSTNARELI